MRSNLAIDVGFAHVAGSHIHICHEVDTMGDVIVVFRIIPESMDFFEEVKKSLEEFKPQRLEEEPIAFGLKAWKFTKIIPDEEGKLPELEEKLSKIKGVQTVDTVEISRSL